jgi:hypothetical protein
MMVLKHLPTGGHRWLVSYSLLRRGYRTTNVTLTDEQAWPDDRLAELYGLRWVRWRPAAASKAASTTSRRR